jgi:hypothetical protein
MADNVSIARHIGNYFENSLEVDSPLWHRLVSAATSLPAFSIIKQPRSTLARLSFTKGEVSAFTSQAETRPTAQLMA